MWKDVHWIGVTREEIAAKRIYQGDMNGRFVYYRYGFRLPKLSGIHLTMKISANSRYRLWINGIALQSGPCRSDRYRQYYEVLELTEADRGHDAFIPSACLLPGINVIAVQVLLCDHGSIVGQHDRRAPLVSVATLPYGHRLAVEGVVTDRDGRELQRILTGKGEKSAVPGWKVWLDDSFYLVSEPVISDNLGATLERIDFSLSPSGWKETDYDDSAWYPAADLGPVDVSDAEKAAGQIPDYNMKERPIPLLMEERHFLTWELGEPAFGAAAAPSGQGFLSEAPSGGAAGSADNPEVAADKIEEDFIRIPPHTGKTFLFALPAVTNTFPVYRFDRGDRARVSMTYFEKFVGEEGRQVRRDDWVNGHPGDGLTDIVVLNGKPVTYEPFWVRAFRFLKIEIQTQAQEAVLYRPVYDRAGYPLQAASRVSSGASWIAPLYDLCLRTLESCMMETYMDCPFWEQMQFPMDTRLQALYTYVCSTDTKLARKALEDFHCSRIPEGLILGKAPVGYPQVISTFSFHFIYMIWEFYERTGDRSVLLRYRSDVDAILEYYDRKIGASGLIESVDYWPFVDWLPEWRDTFGTPQAALQGPSTIINLMAAYALQVAAAIMRETGRTALAEEYLMRQKALCSRVQELCWDAEAGLYREGPALAQFTQHAQSWAVLNHMVSGAAAAALMKRSFEDKQVLPCGFSTSHELFRACEEAGCYEVTRQQMERWIGLLDQHCGTCPETPLPDARSDCHAWSAQPMLEILQSMAGLKFHYACGLYPELVVRPHMEYLPDLRGEMVTDCGMVSFDYRRESDLLLCRLDLPEGLRGVFLRRDGTRVELNAGVNTITEPLCGSAGT